MIFLQLSQQLQTLAQVIASLSQEQYTRKAIHLANATVGAHTRHIIELLQCAVYGYENGTIDYINRKRNLQLETNKILAQNLLQELCSEVKKRDKALQLIPENIDGLASNNIHTTYYREILYNTEHTIHHAALIKVALIEMDVAIDPHFGMAYATIKYKQNIATTSA